MKQPEQMMLYYDRIASWRRLSDSDLGQLFRAVWDYSENGVIPELSPILQMCFDSIQPSIDKNKVKYWEKCTKNAYTAYAREWKHTHSDTEKYPPMKDFEWWAVNPDFLEYHSLLFQGEQMGIEAERILNECSQPSTFVNDCHQHETIHVNVSEHEHGHVNVNESSNKDIDPEAIGRGQRMMDYAKQLEKTKGAQHEQTRYY